MNDDSMWVWVSRLALGGLLFLGMISPLIGYAGYQIGSRNIRPVNVEAERRAGRNQMCLYLAQQAEMPMAEAVPACEQLSVVVK